MRVKEFVLKKMTSRSLLFRVVDNIFSFSDVRFADYVRRRTAEKGYGPAYRELIRQFGLDQYGSDEQTGERFVVDTILPWLFGGSHKDITCFDVGANVGHFAAILRRCFPAANIHCFEPNGQVFTKLAKAASQLNLQAHHTGLGDSTGERMLYTYAGEGNSEHSSLYKDVLGIIQKNEQVVGTNCTIDTLDNMCERLGIGHIHFLKTDTEGHELQVLMGARNTLSQNRISAIQFEFNEMNVISRVFMKDFYDLLPEFDFYRVRKGNLIPLGPYSPYHEVFLYQNILAVHQSLQADVNRFTKPPVQS